MFESLQIQDYGILMKMDYLISRSSMMYVKQVQMHQMLIPMVMDLATKLKH